MSAMTDPPTPELHEAFSEPGATATPWADVADVLARSEIFWLSTVRRDGRPHVTPLPAVWLDGTLHFCTGDAEQKALGAEWRQILDRRLKWRMSHEVVLDLFEPRRGHAFMKAEEVEARVRGFLPPALRAVPFKIDMAQQDPRPLNPIGMNDRQIYVYDAPSRSVSAEPLKELLKYLPGKVAQCRIFATTHEHDRDLAGALEKALGEDRPSHPTNL